METLVTAELDKDATDPWVQSRTDYGWTVKRGLGKPYVRWGSQVFPCDRVLEREDPCCRCEHWYAYRLEKDGKQFYVAGGQAFPAYEEVKLFVMPTDHSSYAFAGYRQGQWHVCYNGHEIASADDVLKIEVANSGDRFAFLMKVGSNEYIQEPKQAGPMFERIKHIEFSAAGQFIAYQAWRDGQKHFVLDHESQVAIPQDKGLLEGYFSIPGNRWACLFGDSSGSLNLLVDGNVVCHSAGRCRPIYHRYSRIFSPDESSMAFPVKTDTGDYALCHDDKVYQATSASEVSIIGWLPGNMPAWISYDKKRGYIYHVGDETESPTMVENMSHIFIGHKGNYACYGTPHGQDGPYPRILVKDGRILQQADFFDTGVYVFSDFGFSSKDRLSYSYSDLHEKDSLAIDDSTLLAGFEFFREFRWAPDGEQYVCFGEKDCGEFLIVNSKLYGSFDESYHADFSNDSRHWCGVMKANDAWIVLLDGQIIDRLELFDFATPFRLFTEDSRWCHYHGIEGRKLVYRRVEL